LKTQYARPSIHLTSQEFIFSGKRIMTMTKHVVKKKPINQECEPTVSRPHMPGYGVPTNKKGLLSWSHVTERMAVAQNYWVSTVSPDGRPHATPVWGLWIDDKLYFGGSPTSRRSRNLAENTAACVHLESGADVVIMHGEATELGVPDPSLTARLIEASARKYGYAPKPEDYAAPGTYCFRPRMVLAWKQFPKDATRWHFQEGD
jgi:nitroimidazol reductase NimA-like FMN-containing flavoprotein (pyridoxamine 5'-phosphate oxidase superfamily)